MRILLGFMVSFCSYRQQSNLVFDARSSRGSEKWVAVRRLLIFLVYVTSEYRYLKKEHLGIK